MTAKDRHKRRMRRIRARGKMARKRTDAKVFLISARQFKRLRRSMGRRVKPKARPGGVMRFLRPRRLKYA